MQVRKLRLNANISLLDCDSSMIRVALLIGYGFFGVFVIAAAVIYKTSVLPLVYMTMNFPNALNIWSHNCSGQLAFIISTLNSK